MHKAPYELEDGDVVDMTPVIADLENHYGVVVDDYLKTSAEFVCYRVLGDPTPWASLEGKHFDVTGSAVDGVTVYFNNGDSWDFPIDLAINVEDD